MCQVLDFGFIDLTILWFRKKEKEKSILPVAQCVPGGACTHGMGLFF
jgi:hypothetical protein